MAGESHPVCLAYLKSRLWCGDLLRVGRDVTRTSGSGYPTRPIGNYLSTSVFQPHALFDASELVEPAKSLKHWRDFALGYVQFGLPLPTRLGCASNVRPLRFY